MRMLLALTLLWTEFLALAQPVVQSRAVTTIMRPPAPMGPAQPEKFEAVSASGRVKIVVEAADDPMVVRRPRTSLTMMRVDRNGSEVLWRSVADASPTPFWQMRMDEIFVAEDGSYCVLPVGHGRWGVFKDGREYYLQPEGGVGNWVSVFNSEDEKLIEFEILNGQPIVRIWHRDDDRWVVFSVKEEKEIKPTPEMVARWNEAARLKILERLAGTQAQELQQRLDAISPKLAKLSQSTGLIKPVDLRDIHYQFLAVRKDPRDREWFERLLTINEKSSRSAKWHRMQTAVNGVYWKSDPYFYESEIGARYFGDEMLAIFDGLVTNKTVYGARANRLFFLGQVSGVVRLPTPILKNVGVVRIYLVPAEAAQRHWISEEIDSIEMEVVLTRFEENDLSDEVSFSFKTAKPGKYLAKAIWDKRKPLTDREQAGPGDYESDWVGPIDLKANGSVSNVFIQCTKRGSGGEDYYAADAIAMRQWRETGEMTLASAAGRGEKEVFSGPLPVWMAQTNFIADGKPVELMRLAMHANGVSGRAQGDLFFPAPLMLTWRRGLRPNGEQGREPALVNIIDEHGCPFSPAQVMTNRRTATARFASFPRTAGSWRLVGYGAGGKSDVLFDYTLTNRVRSARVPMAPRKTPFDLDLGPVRMSVERVVEEENVAWMEAHFSDGEGADSEWRTPAISFLDEDGNVSYPADMCREVRFTRVFGNAIRKAPTLSNRMETIPFEFDIDRPLPLDGLKGFALPPEVAPIK